MTMEAVEECTPSVISGGPREKGLEVFADTGVKDLTDPECQFRQGARAFLHREPEEAIACLEGAKLTNPRCTPWIDLNIALVLMGDGDHSEEVVQLLRNNPLVRSGDTDATRLLALAYLANVQPLMAHDLLQGLLKKEPDNPALHESLGMVYSQLKKYQLAFECFSRAISLSIGIARYYRQAGEALLRLGRIKEALYVVQRAVKCDTYDCSSHELLAKVYSKAGKSEEEAFHRSYAFVLREAFSNL